MSHELTPDSRPPRRKILRLRGFDYSALGPYFVTVCVAGKRCILGDVTKDTVELSPLGEIAREVMVNLPARFAALLLDHHIIMPNHVHALLALVGAGLAPPGCNPATYVKLGDVIGAFKSLSTIEINRRCGTPGAQFWQRGFYEHIIRSGESMNDVRRYISQNPIRWTAALENTPRKRHA
ncbi:MAG TPA: transposase [Candidatus Acidoferrum sp.]|jgi:REP element-mobilizing transposase RayT